MKKKLIAFCVIAAAIVTAGILPHYAKINTSVLHQHRAYPAENKEITGFDSNGALTSHLPIIVIKNNGNVIPGALEPTDEELYCEFEVIDNVNHINRSTDEATSKGKMAVNIRGNSSRHMAKKQYAIRTVDSVGESVNTGFFGMPADNNWVLNGSYIDVSQMRNYILYNISGEIMGYAPRVRLCEAFLTNADGTLSYQGLYTMTEKPNQDKERLNLTPYDRKFAETSFLLQMNNRIDDIRIEHLNQDEIRPYSFNLEYPKLEELTKSSFTYIKKELWKFEKNLYDALATSDWDRVEEKIDMDSFVDYYIINEFFQNTDAGLRSTYIHRDTENKIIMGPVWDFDGAFNNYTGKNYPIDLMSMDETYYYFYLSQDPNFVDRSVKRYKELRKTVLSDEYLLKYIDDTAEYLGSALYRNCDRWYEGDYTRLTNDIDKMKTFVLERGKWMDENFEERTRIVK